MCTSAPAGLISLFYYSWFDYYQYRRAFFSRNMFLDYLYSCEVRKPSCTDNSMIWCLFMVAQEQIHQQLVYSTWWLTKSLYSECVRCINILIWLNRVNWLTGQLADKPTRGQSSRGLDNSRTSQLADSEFFKIMELLHFICTLNLTLIITVILSNIDVVWIV